MDQIFFPAVTITALFSYFKKKTSKKLNELFGCPYEKKTVLEVLSTQDLLPSK